MVTSVVLLDVMVPVVADAICVVIDGTVVDVVVDCAFDATDAVASENYTKDMFYFHK